MNTLTLTRTGLAHLQGAALKQAARLNAKDPILYAPEVDELEVFAAKLVCFLRQSDAHQAYQLTLTDVSRETP